MAANRQWQRRLCAWALVPALLSACSETGSPQEQDKPARLVDVARVVPANGASQTSLTGKVRAVERTVLSFEVGGEIEQLNVDVGDAITRGQVLATLDAERYRLQLEQARASASEAQAALTEKRLDYERQQQLQEQGFVSNASLDGAKAAFDTAQSRYRSAQAAVNIAARDVELTQLKAPFAGAISERLAQPAQRVAPNEPVLEALSERGGFEVYTHVPEALVGKLELGSEQQVRIPALPDAAYAARIEHVGSQPASSNNYPVVLALQEPGADLRAGMTAQVLLSSSSGMPEGVGFLVPMTALIYTEDASVFVLRLGADNRLEKVAVTVLELRRDRALVSGELGDGEQVVSRGAEFVAAGDKVAVLGQGAERFN